MHVTQGTFSYLPPLTDDEIAAQVRYGIEHGWSIAIEHTDDPHPRNIYWEMWGMPMFDLQDPAPAMREIGACREAFAERYVRVTVYDASLGRQTTALQFIVNRPADEPGFRLDRSDAPGRVAYATHPYAADRPHGSRYER